MRHDILQTETVVRNYMGVQMLSRTLHNQIFKNVSFPRPDRRYIRLAREHLRSHNLDITQGSVLPEAKFTLPPLQGQTIDEHFYNIGAKAAEPWLSLAKGFADIERPPKPEYWHIQPGWTKYHYSSDGCGYSESVSALDEDLLVFDVETMPGIHPFAVIACAMSPTNWYSWISPWLLGLSDEQQHLIPFGSPQTRRVVVGHNVSYDRARILEEYHVSGTQTRFLDTMALHVAVKGISSHQRPAWMKYRKDKSEESMKKAEEFQEVMNKLDEVEAEIDNETDTTKKEGLKRSKEEVEESLAQLIPDGLDDDVAEAEALSKRWEDITSANSLEDVAKLHCGIRLRKAARNDFLTHTREEILSGIQEYLDYCWRDVDVTHAVYAKVFPEYLKACPNPVSFAGILTMGSSFLTVNHSWRDYLENSERVYSELNERVKQRLLELAEEARPMMEDESWKNDVWLSQLDWTPKVAGKSRGIGVSKKPEVRHLRSVSCSTPGPNYYYR